MLFICEPFGSGLCAVRIDLTIARLPCLLGLFRKAVIVELIMTPCPERREHCVQGMGKLPPTKHWLPEMTQSHRRVLHDFCSALPGQSHLLPAKRR